MNDNRIQLFEAIRQMRHLSTMGVPFSFSFATCSLERRETHGIKHVNNALLRPAAASDDFKNASHMLFYLDDDRQPKHCYQILLMYFNGMRIYI